MMYNYNKILDDISTQELKDLENIIFNAKKLLLIYPKDLGLQISLYQAKERKNKLLIKLKEQP